MKDTIKYEVAEAERMTGADIGRALALQARMYEQSRQFFERYDYFVLPVTQVAPFDVNVPYPTEIAGTPMATYLDWMRSCWYVTFMSNPTQYGKRRVGAVCTAGQFSREPLRIPE